MHSFRIFHCMLCAAVNQLQPGPQRFATLMSLQVAQFVDNDAFH